MTTLAAPRSGALLHRPARTGDRYRGPGDLYRLLVAGAEPGGAYFAMEARVPPGGGPPPHLQRAIDPTLDRPEPPEAGATRYAAAAPRYGIELLGQEAGR